MGVIAYRNLADTATVVAGNSLAGFPVANLKTRQLSESWRSESLANHDLTITFATPTKLRVVGLFGCNLAGMRTSTICTVRYYVPSPPAGEPNWQAVPIYFAPDAGAPELAPSVVGIIPRSFPASTQWRVTPNWALPLGISYYEAGRLWLGDALDVDMEVGITNRTNDPGSVDISAGNEVVPDHRKKGREVLCSINADCKAAYGFDDPGTLDYSNPIVAGMADYAPSLDDLFAYAGATREVVLIPIDRAPLWIRRTAVRGRMTSDSLQINHRDGVTFDANITLIEEF